MVGLANEGERPAMTSATTRTAPGAPALARGSFPHVPGVAAELPDGRAANEVAPAELRRLLHDTGAPFPPDAGYAETVAAYSAFAQSMTPEGFTACDLRLKTASAHAQARAEKLARAEAAVRLQAQDTEQPTKLPAWRRFSRWLISE